MYQEIRNDGCVISSRSGFSIPRDPVRRLVRGIETFNVLRGGELFMPSLSALKWLADLNN